MAVYAYVVPEEQTKESYPDGRIVYLKLTCSITGWNPSEELIDPKRIADEEDELDDLQQSAWEGILADDWSHVYWPCKGAIAQVAIYPHSDDDVGPDEFPHILDFQPKKRELYETRSETGEYLSGTSEKVNVQSGRTTTESSEESDIKTGYSGKVGFTLPGNMGGGELSGSYTGEWGTRSSTGEETVDMRTTDTSRERRETTSFSTSFSQMYQLFNGYHLGTNRALFLISPRPHTVTSASQVDFNLIRGKRMLEGLQDMFLVVFVPSSVSGLCLQANLDTGHPVMVENGMMYAAALDNDSPIDGGGSGGDDRPPFPPAPEFADTDQRVSNQFSRRLVVTRRVIRNCGRFTDSGRLQPTGPGEFPDEEKTPIVFEDIIQEGISEHAVVSAAKTSEEAIEVQRFVASQRNRFQNDITQSMLSGFTADRYRQRTFSETEAFRELTRFSLGRIEVDADVLVETGVLTEEELQLLRRFGVKEIREVFDERLSENPNVDEETLRDIRERITSHALEPIRSGQED
ncbi:hypothetical protein [Haladaptatus sp. NG-SE-30]